MFISLSNQLNDFFIILFSIVIEGIPFILIGALLSGLMEQYVTPERISRALPKNRFLQYLSMTLLGNVMPVCECGNIPFARRLILKKVPTALALTFLLAAPVLNPLVILATIAAFSNDLSIVVYRVLFTLIIAISVGALISFLPESDVLVTKLQKARDSKKQLSQHHHSANCNHHHNHHSESCNHDHGHHHNGKSALKNVFEIVRKEFLEMTGVFIFGASIAATIQLFLPQDLVAAFNSQEWAAILAMMLLAFVVSICSNVDAFFALAYAQVFPTSAILAFLVFGPMLDIKAIPMFKTIFRWKPLFLIMSLVATISFLLSYFYFLFT